MSGAADIAANAWVEVDFSPDPGFQLIFDGIHATEELGRPFLYEIELSSGKRQENVSSLIGSRGTVWLAQSAEGKDDTFFNGVVTKVVSHGLARGAYRYSVELRPWLWLLSRVVDCRIFNNKSPFDIITTIFRDAGFSDFEDARQASAGDTVLEYCVQYRESSLDFVHRLMEQYGIYYFFTHTRSKHTLKLADDPNSHKDQGEEVPFSFDQTEQRTVGDHVFEWSAAMGLESGKFTYRDYDFTKPSADLTSKTTMPGSHQSYKDLEVYQYPGFYKETSDGQKLTDVHLQAITKDRLVMTAKSNARGLHTGWKFKLKEHPQDSQNRSYLIIRSTWEMQLAEGSSSVRDQGETVDTYRVSCDVIPDDTHFRLRRLTPSPMIRGPQTALVVGSSGSEIDTDQYGRILVKFYWDRAEIEDDKRTCRIRVAQSTAGKGWGSMVLPRVGQEVIVEFLEGNPDRPLVTGVVYNATNTVPYSLPDNQTRMTFKSNSSKGGGGFNELRFEDKKDSEEVFFQAQKDYNKVVLNNETVKITQDTTTTVEKGNRSVTVSQGNDTTTVSQGNHSLTVSAGTSTIEAAQSITLKVGQNSIVIDTSGITIKAMKVEVDSTAGDITLSSQMNLALKALINLTGEATAEMQLKATAGMTLNGGASLAAQAAMISLN
ncbi:MAG TPA: type VI secretion system tip protein TssI/VgrG [Rhodopila sp.]|uniref:type VI secretion system Vgr family protein n=1 Tax=Rhodopila sp. TaxID=2480087 RepID=UPI002C578327|nr:type VI secretion system tip protein TssI/VgrG [Rhodopila sp.]HVY16443.1 type VI secretion system tip protein TssI/VgrG [Rhodopila sp.]